MRHIAIPAANFVISRLGFGCAGLMARLNRRQSAELLRTALGSGITHFDTARLYGYGEAESVLGEVLAGRRASVTVTSKIGILPPQRSGFLTAARGVTRKLAALHPTLRRMLRNRAASMVRSGVFDIPSITKSLETSLRELRTDYLDILLLHECREADLERPELLEFLEAAKRKGMIRHYGIATLIEETEAVLDRQPAFTKVVQFANNVWNRNLDRLNVVPAAAVITHSALGADFTALTGRLSADPALRRSWSDRLGCDAGNRTELAQLFLAYALQANARGAVLVSSSNPANILANVRLAEEDATYSDRVQALVTMIEAGLPSRSGTVHTPEVRVGSR